MSATPIHVETVVSHKIVLLASHEWLERNLPDVKIKPIEELMGHSLDLKAANGLSIPYVGFSLSRVQAIKLTN